MNVGNDGIKSEGDGNGKEDRSPDGGLCRGLRCGLMGLYGVLGRHGYVCLMLVSVVFIAWGCFGICKVQCNVEVFCQACIDTFGAKGFVYKVVKPHCEVKLVLMVKGRCCYGNNFGGIFAVFAKDVLQGHWAIHFEHSNVHEDDVGHVQVQQKQLRVEYRGK